MTEDDLGTRKETEYGWCPFHWTDSAQSILSKRSGECQETQINLGETLTLRPARNASWPKKNKNPARMGRFHMKGRPRRMGVLQMRILRNLRSKAENKTGANKATGSPGRLRRLVIKYMFGVYDNRILVCRLMQNSSIFVEKMERLKWADGTVGPLTNVAVRKVDETRQAAN